MFFFVKLHDEVCDENSEKKPEMRNSLICKVLLFFPLCLMHFHAGMRHLLHEIPNLLSGQLGTIVIQIISVKWPLMRDLKEKRVLPL